MKRLEPADAGAIEDVALRAAIETIERVTGHRPPTCPWRAFTTPIVREVTEVSWAAKDGGGALPAIIGTDAPYKLVQGLGVYRRAVDATKADEERLESEKRKAKAAAERSARRARRG